MPNFVSKVVALQLNRIVERIPNTPHNLCATVPLLQIMANPGLSYFIVKGA